MSWIVEEEQSQPSPMHPTDQHLNPQRANWSPKDEDEGTALQVNPTRVSTNRSPIEVVQDKAAGWRAGVTAMALLTLMVLLLNSVLTGLAFHRRHEYSNDRGLATFYAGSCSVTDNINRSIKLGINILASCLLGASNYCMQILISPLREEIDRAHAKKQWLFVGMPNFKNLYFISYKRRIVWTALFVTSVPLHLFWNSAVVHTTIANNYFVAGVSQDFIQGTPTTITPYNTQPWFLGQDHELQDWLIRARNGNGNITDLSSQQCLDVYANNFIDQYSNLVMVMNTTNMTNSLLFAGTHVNEVLSHAGLGELWPCGIPAPHTRPCGFGNIRRHNATHWTPLITLAGTDFEKNDTYLASLSGTSVIYCMAEKLHPQCRLGVHPQILVTVLVCNAVKLIGIVATWFFADSKDDKCITSGDLIRSYIRSPDPRFYNRCLANIDLIKKYPEEFWDNTKPWPLKWHKQRIRSWRGAPTIIWLFYIIPAFCGTIAVLGIFLGYHLQNTLYVGFGTPSLSSTLPWHSNDIRVIQATIVANLPQLIVGYIYVGCNAVLTGIWSQHEILHHSKAVLNVIDRFDSNLSGTLTGRQLRRAESQREKDGPQALRVSRPKGGQRETYYLTLPWTTAVPLLLGSITLHWFVSEALFLLRVAVVDTNGFEDVSKVITTVGYSSGAMLAVLLGLFIQLLIVMGVGWFKQYDMTMPLVGACSAAIGAISQPPVDDQGKAQFDNDMDLGKLYWGVVSRSSTTIEQARMRKPFRFENSQGQQSLLSGTALDPAYEEFDDYSHATFAAREIEALVEGRMYA